MNERRRVKIGRGGRIVVPAAYRRSQELIARYVPPDISLVDELFAERRREAAREEAEE